VPARAQRARRALVIGRGAGDEKAHRSARIEKPALAGKIRPADRAAERTMDCTP
jgi:hypothetical protein